MAVTTGLHASVPLRVTDEDTAAHFRSGDVPVLATPRLVALCEEAACRALAPKLSTGQTSVGLRVQLDHLAPSAVGSSVTAEATLEKMEGRRLTFTVKVTNNDSVVCAGFITRVIVDRDAFIAKAR